MLQFTQISSLLEPELAFSEDYEMRGEASVLVALTARQARAGV